LGCGNDDENIRRKNQFGGGVKGEFEIFLTTEQQICVSDAPLMWVALRQDSPRRR